MSESVLLIHISFKMYAIINGLINLISNINLIMHSLNQPMGWLCRTKHIYLFGHSFNHLFIIIVSCILAETELALLCLIVFDLGLITVPVDFLGNSFLIQFFATFPNMPLCFSAISYIKTDDFVVPSFGPCIGHHSH